MGNQIFFNIHYLVQGMILPLLSWFPNCYFRIWYLGFLTAMGTFFPGTLSTPGIVLLPLDTSQKQIQGYEAQFGIVGRGKGMVTFIKNQFYPAEDIIEDVKDHEDCHQQSQRV